MRRFLCGGFTSFSCRDGDAATRNFPQVLDLHESVGFQILRIEVLVI